MLRALVPESGRVVQEAWEPVGAWMREKMARLFPQMLATEDQVQHSHLYAAVRVHRADRVAAFFSRDRPTRQRRQF